MKNRGFFYPLLHFDAMPIKLYNIKKKSYKYLFSFYNAVKIVRGQKYSVCPGVISQIRGSAGKNIFGWAQKYLRHDVTADANTTTIN